LHRSTPPRRAWARRPLPACLLATTGLAFALSLVGAPAATAAGSQVGPTGTALVPAGSVASYVVAQANGAPSVFVKGAGGSLWNYWYANGTWGSYEMVPAGVTSSPTVILQSDGSPSVFFEGAGGALWNYWYVPSQAVWGSKEIAAGVASTPAVGVQSNGAPTIFVQASDGSLVNYFYVASQGIWGAETVAAAGTASSAPAVMGQVNAGGAPSVFVEGPGGSLLNYWYVPWMGSWGSATVAGAGSAASAPALLPQSNGAPSVFVEGPGGSLANYWYVPSMGSWGSATIAGGGSDSSAPAVMGQVSAGGAPSVFVAGPGGSLVNYWYVPSQGVWGAATVENAGQDATTPGLTAQANGAPSVFFQSADGTLWNYWYANGSWLSADPSAPAVTVPAGAPYFTFSAVLNEGGSGTGYSAYINARDSSSDAIGIGIQTDNSEASLHGQPWYIWELVQNGNFSFAYINQAPVGNEPVTLEWWPASQEAVFYEGSTPVADIPVHLAGQLYFGVEGDARQNGDSVNDVISNTQITAPGSLGAWNDTSFNSYGLTAHDSNGKPQNGADFTVTGTCSGDPSPNWGYLPMPAGIALISGPNY